MCYKNHFNVQRISIKMPATTFNCKVRLNRYVSVKKESILQRKRKYTLFKCIYEGRSFSNATRRIS